MTLLAVAHAAPAPTGDSLNTVFLVIMIMTAFAGTGIVAGLIALYRWVKRQGVRDGRLDALIDEQTGAMARLERLEHKISPNGGPRDQIGNIAKRTEDAIKDLKSTMDRHIGECDAEHRWLRHELDRKAERV